MTSGFKRNASNIASCGSVMPSARKPAIHFQLSIKQIRAALLHTQCWHRQRVVVEENDVVLLVRGKAMYCSQQFNLHSAKPSYPTHFRVGGSCFLMHRRRRRSVFPAVPYRKNHRPHCCPTHLRSPYPAVPDVSMSRGPSKRVQHSPRVDWSCSPRRRRSWATVF